MATTTPALPDAAEYLPYFDKYISLVPEKDILEAMKAQLKDIPAVLRDVTEAETEKRHPPYTWSVKEVIGHLVDCERIFGVRALRFARNDPTPLPGFEENDYVRQAHFDARSLGDLVEEFEFVRRSHIGLFRGLDGAAWLRTGIANGALVSVRAIAYILVGHVRHHVSIVRKRLSKS